MRHHYVTVAAVSVLLGGVSLLAAEAIPRDSKVFIAPMDGFEAHLKEAFAAKKVPLQIVDSKETADFELTGTSTSQKAGVAKILIRRDWRSKEEASITITDLKSGTVVFAYTVHKSSSAHGKRSAAEACAKHVKEKVEKK